MPDSGGGSASGVLVVTPDTWVTLTPARRTEDSLIINRTATLLHEEAGDMAWTPSTISWLIKDVEDEEKGSGTPDVRPGDAAEIQTFRALYTPNAVGEQTAEWLFVADDDPYHRYEPYFVYWTDVPKLVRSRANRSTADLRGEDIDREAAYLVARLLLRWTCLGSYADLLGSDRAFFDRALALLILVKTYPSSNASGFGSGTVTRWKQDDNEVQYSTGQNQWQNMSGESGTWMGEAMDALGQVACIRAELLAGLANFSPFVAWGATRARRAQNFPDSLLTSVLSLLSDDTTYQRGW